MNESSVSSPLMAGLRLALPGSVVVKHRDASMIGLPDCSIHWNRISLWLEFKLWVPPKSWDGNLIPVEKIVHESPTQFQMMQRLAQQATGAYYVLWAKKSHRVCIWSPVTGDAWYFTKTSEVLGHLVEILQHRGQ